MSKAKQRKKPAAEPETIVTVSASESTTDLLEPDQTEEEVDIESPETPEPQGRLMACRNTHMISREELSLITVPPTTRTYKPVPHIRIIEALVESLGFRHIRVISDEYAVSDDGQKMFGLLVLDHAFTGCQFCIGVRNANDKSMRLGLTCGFRVEVCSNMMFSGDFTPVLHKHSNKLDLVDVVSIAVDKIQRNFEPIKGNVAQLQQNYLNDNEARLIIYQAFLQGKLPLPLQLLRTVNQEYFSPSFDEFKERNLWSLMNSFTTAFKQLKPMNQFRATAKLGDFLKQFVMPY